MVSVMLSLSTISSKLQEAMQDCDPTGHGYIEQDQLQHVCHSLGLPLSHQLIHGTIMK